MNATESCASDDNIDALYKEILSLERLIYLQVGFSKYFEDKYFVTIVVHIEQKIGNFEENTRQINL